MKKKKPIKMKIEPKIDMTEIDEMIEKTERLNRLLKEANSLADELASKTIKSPISVGVNVSGKPIG